MDPNTFVMLGDAEIDSGYGFTEKEREKLVADILTFRNNNNAAVENEKLVVVGNPETEGAGRETVYYYNCKVADEQPEHEGEASSDEGKGSSNEGEESGDEAKGPEDKGKRPRDEDEDEGFGDGSESPQDNN
ncbi:hypothetical protein H4R18_001508 [Coemansia javaensis]|uniref:Uncharacterized protein n=1 Tax=Coemansia javaensis TaxID=2761396 RepID=A0A9W8HCL2_9FUNG|nr:hypothetical protein H4R18_001508 [Coemansia javaensis]